MSRTLAALLALLGGMGLILCEAANAGDPYSGVWLGQGLATMQPEAPKPHVRACSEIGIELRENALQLDFAHGYYRCEDLDASYDPARFQIRDGHLFEDGTDIGSINAEKIEISMADPSDGSTFHLSLTPEAGFMKYLEEWSQGGQIQLRVEGKLSRQSPAPH